MHREQTAPLIVAMLAVMLAGPGASAQSTAAATPDPTTSAAATPVPAVVPTDTIAFYQADPAGFNPPAAWLAPLIRLLDAAGLVRIEDQPVADAILAATLLGSHRHTLALLDLNAQRLQPGELKVNRIQMVLQVDAPGRFNQFHQSLTTILTHYGQGRPRTQTTIQLPGGRQAVRYRVDTWPAWFTLEWTADDQRFYLGVGAGSLRRWFANPDRVLRDVRPVAHRQAVAAPADQPPLFELFIDLDRCRRAAPTLFTTGRTTPLLQVFNVDQASAAMLHGRWAGTFLMLDMTVAQNGRIEHRPLTLDHWPADAGVPKPAGRFHIAAPVDWRQLYDGLMRIVWLAYDGEGRFTMDQAVADFQQRTGQDPKDLLHQIRPYLLVSDYPRFWLPIPGSATIYLPLRRDENASLAEQRFRKLMLPLEKTPIRAADGSLTFDPTVGIAHEPARDVYWLDSPMRALFKAPAWGPVRRTRGLIFVGSYNPLAVLKNRAWLEER